MKITSQLLRNTAVEPLKQARYLDLSRKRIGGIQCLEVCRQLQTLILHSNVIDTISNLECCRELWNIDVSGNKVRSLNGLSQFPFLGCLSLSANTLDWSELRKLSHLRILSLTLNGNPKLVKDKHYRKHVIDLLPNVWMLDGQLITAAERKQTQQFFVNSASTSHPVRHKFSSQSTFVPSFRKNLTVTGVFGRRTSSVMTKFPLHEIHNIELDQRRLLYLAEMLEEDMKVESEYRKNKDMKSFTPPQIKTLLEHRNEEIEQTNMLLLLLVALLMFNIPEELLAATFDIAKLTLIGHVKCHDLISLPRSIILRLSSLLLSAVAIDKDSNKDGGLYPQLYHAIQWSIHSLHSKLHLLDVNSDTIDQFLSSTPSTLSTTTTDTLSRSTTPSIASSSCSTVSFSSFFKPHAQCSSQQSIETICLLASEVVHLMCLVPMFFELLEIDQDVIQMVAIATRNNDIVDVVNHIKWKVLDTGGNVWDVYQQVATYLLQSTTANVFSKRKVPSFKLSSSLTPTASSHSSSHLYQTKRQNRVTTPPRSQSAGAVSSFRRRHRTPHQPEIGDLILCAPERLARILSLQEHVAVLELCSPIHGMSGPPDSLFYTDTRGLQWDRAQGHWTRDDLSADLSMDRLHSDTTVMDGNQSPSSDHVRPMSHLSHISDELPTILSLEEMNTENESVLDMLKEEDEEDMNDLPMTISISGRQSVGTQRTNTPESTFDDVNPVSDSPVITSNMTSSTDSKSDTFKENIETGDEKPPLTYEQWVIDNHLSGSLTEGQDVAQLTVTVPKLIHPAVWESSKSVPSTRFSTSSKKPHSCSKKDFVLPSADSDPLSHVDLSSHTNRSPSPTLTLMPFNEPKPTLVHAWTAPKLGYPKQTSTSKNRKMKNTITTLPSSTAINPVPVPATRILSPSSPSSHPLTVPQNTPTHTSPVHAIYSTTMKNRYHFQPIKKKQNIAMARKLGDLKSLSVFGATAW